MRFFSYQGGIFLVIQWYPGHMAKARRNLLESLKLIDVVVEVVDARAPHATRNPDFDEIFKQKDRVLILNKSDLANESATKEWINYYKKQNINAAAIIATRTSSRKTIIKLVEQAAKERVEKMRAKGVIKTIRAMIVGIPNVGKSALINCCVGGTKAKVGNRPGVTKGQQWVKISPYLELLDTPGLLWPKLEDSDAALRLAFLGSIRDEIMDKEQLAENLIRTLAPTYAADLENRYGPLPLDNLSEEISFLEKICMNRGFLFSGGMPDTERCAGVVLEEFRSSKIAKISLEMPKEDQL